MKVIWTRHDLPRATTFVESQGEHDVSSPPDLADDMLFVWYVQRTPPSLLQPVNQMRAILNHRAIIRLDTSKHHHTTSSSWPIQGETLRLISRSSDTAVL